MTTMFKKATLALALGATALTAAAPAEAQRWGGRRDNTGIALLAGVAGLAIGAAIVSSSNDRNRRYAYNDSYRDGYGYDDRGDYRRSGYDNYGYRDQRGYGCHYESRWDGYARRNVSVQVCD